VTCTSFSPRPGDTEDLECVVKKLSYLEQETIVKRKITELRQFDLAALIKLFDGNWFPIANKLNLLPEYRHLIKEMQGISNRWAHTSGNESSFDDKYRDLDTIQRFLLIIAPDSDANSIIQELKDAVLLNSKKNLFKENQIIDNKTPVHQSIISSFAVFNELAISGQIYLRPGGRYYDTSCKGLYSFATAFILAVNLP
jgi:Swt1-like HEPN